MPLDYHGLVPHLSKEERKKVVSEFEKKYSNFWDSVNVQSTSLIVAMMMGAGLASALGLFEGEIVSRILWGVASVLPSLPISGFVGKLVRSKNESKFLEFISESQLGVSEEGKVE